MMKIPINSNLDCIIDHKKDDCCKEDPHCHIVRRGTRVAQIWLNPVSVAYGHSLDRRELIMALNVVEANRSRLLDQYLYNMYNGAD